jgi:tetratricopeptide (TPR) repeat protein
MSGSPSKLSRFWHELKRRKVLRVIAMYAGAAYIVIELVSNVSEPLHLPEWIATLVILLLVTGFPVVAIVSWIFDITPEGVIKTVPEETPEQGTEGSSRRRLKISDVVITILVAVICILLYPKIFQGNSLDRLRASDERITVAVMPFQNMTNDNTWNIWQSGIQFNVLTILSNYSGALEVRQSETTNYLIRNEGIRNYTSMSPDLASRVWKRLDANVFVFGNIIKSGPTIRLNAQLIDAKTKNAYRSFQIDGTDQEILHLIDSLSVMLKNSLLISSLALELPSGLRYHPSTTSPEAYRYYLYGDNARSRRDYVTAKEMYSNALAIDSNFAMATLMLSVTCINQGLYEEARNWCDRAYEQRDRMSLKEQILAEKNHAFFYATPVEEISCLRRYLKIDDLYPGTYYDIGLAYAKLQQYDKAIPPFERSLEIRDELGTKPWWVYNYTQLGEAYHRTAQYKKEKRLYRKAEKDFPDDPTLVWREAILLLTVGDTAGAGKCIDRYKSIYRENSWSGAALARNLGWAYNQAGMPGKAEESFRRAIRIEPESGFWYYFLGKHLIDHDRDIERGLELIDKALELNPDHGWYFLDSKGWGLYKQGKYQEALKILHRCRDLQIYYNHELTLHIEEAEKALSKQASVSN